ncbi:reticulon-4 receptor-like [Polymixia lowei]
MNETALIQPDVHNRLSFIVYFSFAVGKLCFLVLWLQSVPQVESCPAPCICHSEPRPSLSCQQQGLRYVPSEIPALTQRIFLQNNRLMVVRSTSFSACRNLTELWLYSNNISHIEAGAFFGLEKLEMLDLGDNDLRIISPTAFRGLSRLHSLQLHRCRLSELPVGVFRGLFSLQQLFLQENNLLALHDDMFLDLGKLTSLFLHSNKLKTVTDHMFRGLSNLDKLLLHQNQVTFIQNQAFHDLGKLTTLYIFFNNLTVLSGETMKPLVSLRYLRLNGNQWICDCRTRPLWDWFKGFNGASSDLECNVPTRLKGKDLKRLKSTDLDGCYDNSHHTWISVFNSKTHSGKFLSTESPLSPGIPQCCLSDNDRSSIFSSKGVPDLSFYNSRQITNNPLKEKENISKTKIIESEAIKNGSQNKQSPNDGPSNLDLKPDGLDFSSNPFGKTKCTQINMSDLECVKDCVSANEVLKIILLLMISLSLCFC